MSMTQSQLKQPLFALGRLVATPGALELLTRSEQTPLEFLARHSRGDWGECCAEDATGRHSKRDWPGGGVEDSHSCRRDVEDG